MGVRARNGGGYSNWRNSPPTGPWVPPPPRTPSSVSVTRGDSTLTAEWPAAAGAASYHITYSPDGGQDWYLAAFEHTATTITIHGVSTTPPT